ncbi:hypothetical protein [Exiguobacterium artemiae]
MDFRKMLIAGLGALLIFYLFREPPAPDYKKKFNTSIETVIKLENEELVRQNHDPIVRKKQVLKSVMTETGLNCITIHLCREIKKVSTKSRVTGTCG